MSGTILHTLPWGTVETYDDNEVAVVSRIPDPPKVRLSVVDSVAESNLGAVSFNLRRPDGRDEEYGLIQGRLTSDRQSGALYMAVRPPNAQEVREVLYIDSAVAKFSVPVIAPGGAPSGPGPGRVTRFYSDNGQFCFNVQGDNGGFIVQYDTHGSEDESTWTAVAVFRGTPV